MADKLDKISDDIGCIKVTLAGQAVELREHMRRTSLLEDALKPVSLHVMRVEGAMKILGALALVATVTTGVVDLARFIMTHLGG